MKPSKEPHPAHVTLVVGFAFGIVLGLLIPFCLGYTWAT